MNVPFALEVSLHRDKLTAGLVESSLGIGELCAPSDLRKWDRCNQQYIWIHKNTHTCLASLLYYHNMRKNKKKEHIFISSATILGHL